MKREVYISGKLIFPLREGNAAVILRQSDMIRTSTRQLWYRYVRKMRIMFALKPKIRYIRFL